MKVLYDTGSLQGAAQWLEENHPSINKDAQEWYNDIKEMMLKHAPKEDATVVGTAGYYIYYYDSGRDDDGRYVAAQALVDMGTGRGHFFEEVNV